MPVDNSELCAHADALPEDTWATVVGRFPYLARQGLAGLSRDGVVDLADLCDATSQAVLDSVAPMPEVPRGVAAELAVPFDPVALAGLELWSPDQVSRSCAPVLAAFVQGVPDVATAGTDTLVALAVAAVRRCLHALQSDGFRGSVTAGELLAEVARWLPMVVEAREQVESSRWPRFPVGWTGECWQVTDDGPTAVWDLVAARVTPLP